LPQLSTDDYEAITAKTDHDHDESGHGESAQAQALPTDPVAAVDAFHQALQDGNGKAALALLHDKATVLEEGQIETKQEYAGHHLGADMEFKTQTETEQVSRENKVQGPQATVTTRSHTTGSYNGAPVDVVTDESASLYRSDNGWLITHIQWSSVSDDTD
jgi:ketosteroid isomerase-like protein